MANGKQEPDNSGEIPVPNMQTARWQRMRRLSGEEIVQLAQRKERGDQKAREILIEHTMWLVISIARAKTITRPQLFEDAIAFGAIGLTRAVDRFDWRRGFRLSTFATYWITMEIGHALENFDRLIRFPDHVKRELSRICQCEVKLAAQLNREPTIEELACETGFSKERIVLLTSFAFISLDMEMPTSEGESITLKDTLPSASLTPEQEVIHRDWRRHLASYLPNGKVEIRHLTYQLLSEFAEEFGLTPKGIKALLLRSCEHIKKWLGEIRNETKGNPDE